MGFREWFFGTKSQPTPLNLPVAPVTYETPNPAPLVLMTVAGQEIRVDLEWLRTASPQRMYETQPYLRSIISFLGRNVAQLGIGVYRRISDEERIKVSDSVTAQLLREPNPYMTRYELIDALVCDMALWDQTFWWVLPDKSRAAGYVIHWLPAAWVTSPVAGTAAVPDYWWVNQPDRPAIQVPAAQVIHFHGWNPSSLVYGTSPVATLKAILEEQVAAVIYRGQRWERGARVGTVITRPADAPKWSETAETRFRQEWNERYTGRSGSEAGGTPILQDGMTLNRIGFSAVEDEFVEASKLALTTVAAVYHVNPTMVGLLDNANYSNVREFRRMLYGDTLGPWLAMIEGRINAFLLPLIGEEPGTYVEFNIAEKLQGSFEEQAQVASAAVGGPYMTRNEYRSRMNLPPIDGGDELIVPLNVTAGGQANPQTPTQVPTPGASIRLSHPSDEPAKGLMQVISPSYRSLLDQIGNESGSYDPGGWLGPSSAERHPVRGKIRATQRQVDATTAVLRKFYQRQERVVLSKLGSKSDEDWWDEDRWDEELADDLYRVASRVNADLGGKVIDGIGLPDPFDPEANADYLRAIIETRATSINSTTKAQIDDALSRVDEEDAPTPADVFDSAQGQRSITGAQSIMTTVAAVATEEAGRQAEVQTGGEATKTWVVTSTNSRHPEMDGETVPLNENFSNGAAWPGDAVLGPDETAGCTCDLVINVS